MQGKNLKIGIVCYPTLGGSGIVATELGHALASKGHEIHFITYEIPFRLNLQDSNIFFHEVNIHEYDLFRYPDYALTLAVRIAEVAKEKNLDILHVHYAIPHATSAFLAKQLLGSKSPPLVTTLHGTDITLVGRDPAYFQIVKFSIEQSSAITAVSQSLKDETISYFGIEKSIYVIHNFFSPEQDLIDHKPLRGNCLLRSVKEDEKLLLHSSNFRSVKRVEDVITIFYEVQKQIKSKLILLGSGPKIPEIKKMIKNLNLQDHIFLFGKIHHVDPYVASCDLFLLPSEQESFGLAAIEAMAYGLPVIATRVGGLPEVIEDEVTGFLSEVGDTKKMAKNAIQLLSDPILYERMSLAAKKRVKEKFSIEKILPQYEELYRKLLKH